MRGHIHGFVGYGFESSVHYFVTKCVSNVCVPADHSRLEQIPAPSGVSKSFMQVLYVIEFC